jgi:hypothetical protein
MVHEKSFSPSETLTSGLRYHDTPKHMEHILESENLCYAKNGQNSVRIQGPIYHGDFDPGYTPTVQDILHSRIWDPRNDIPIQRTRRARGVNGYIVSRRYAVDLSDVLIDVCARRGNDANHHFLPAQRFFMNRRVLESSGGYRDKETRHIPQILAVDWVTCSTTGYRK